MELDLLNKIFGTMGANTPPVSSFELFKLFLNSFVLGSVLAVFTFITIWSQFQMQEEGHKRDRLKLQTILGASNILFLCVGLTGVMILVANNLARALSIGATMALMRFRVKLGNKNLGSNLLFGIIVGVACGLQEIVVAWMVTGIYLFLQLILFLVLKNFEKKSFVRKKNQPKLEDVPNEC